MGSQQSTAAVQDEKVYQNNIPIELSQSLVNYLTDTLTSSDTSPERQSALDDQVRMKLKAEISRLREEEENLKNMVATMLEKENIDTERDMAGSENPEEVGAVKNSTVLLSDLDIVREKVERYRSKQELDDYIEIGKNKDALRMCYSNNAGTPLNCWKEVVAFKTSVARAEQKYLYSKYH